MQFGRKDYDEGIDCTNNIHTRELIPSSEPVFLLRGQDPLAYVALEEYRKLLKEKGLFEMEKSVKRQITAMKKYLFNKFPDAKVRAKIEPNLSEAGKYEKIGGKR